MKMDTIRLTAVNRDRIRWGASFTAIIALHLAVAIQLLMAAPKAATVPPAAAIFIELAPMLAAPTKPLNQIPVGPEQVAAVPPRPEPEPKPEPAPKEAELPLLPKPLPVPPKPRQIDKQWELKDTKKTITATTAPPSIEAPQATKAVAPAEGAQSRAPSVTPVSWRSVLLGHLQRHKKYPPIAMRRGQEGVAYVRFAIDRSGNVLSRKLERSSGSSFLDKEALELIVRSQPLPPPPPSVSGAVVEIIVPVQFFLRN